MLADRDQRILAHEVERATLLGRLASTFVQSIRTGRRGETPTAGDPPDWSRSDTDRGWAPPSDRVCDAVIQAFALWTVCAHTVGASGGGLVALIVLYALALAGGVALKLRWGSGSAPPAAKSFAEPPHSFRPAPDQPRVGIGGGRTLPVVVVIVGLAVTLSFARWPDALRLWWSTVLLLGVLAVAVFWRDVPRISTPQASRASERRLWLLALMSVVLTLVAHRPDADDALYVNVAVAAVDVPGQALLSTDTLHGVDGLPIYLPVYRVHSYELWNAALAYLTGIPAIYVFHWISAAFAALLVPLAHARLFRLLTPRWWLWSVGVLTVILVVAGETHRWYGNFAFVRIWQGKAVFLSVLLPLIYAYGLRFAVQPTVRGWTLLCAAQIAAVGCTSSALWAAPASALLALVCALRPSRQGVKIAALSVLGSVYVLGLGWLVKANLLVSWSPLGGDPGTQLHRALITTLGDSRLLLFGIGTLLVAGAVAPPGLARRFAVMGPLAVLVGLLNPYVADWIVAGLTGPAYWRSMWALPLPILMTLVLTSPLRIGRSRTVLGRVLCLGLVAAFALLVPRYSALSATNGVLLGWPRLKVPDAAYRWAAIINRSVPPGTHVAAPSNIDPWIGTFHRHAYPVLVRHYLRTRPGLMEPDDIQHRLMLRQALDAPELVDAAPRQFREGLDRFQVRAVCLANSRLADTARRILAQAGFDRTIRADDYELWIRSDVGVASPRTVVRLHRPVRWTAAAPPLAHSAKTTAESDARTWTPPTDTSLPGDARRGGAFHLRGRCGSPRIAPAFARRHHRAGRLFFRPLPPDGPVLPPHARAGDGQPRPSGVRRFGGFRSRGASSSRAPARASPSSPSPDAGRSAGRSGNVVSVRNRGSARTADRCRMSPSSVNLACSCAEDS